MESEELMAVTEPAYWKGKVDAYEEMKGFVDKVLPVMQHALEISRLAHGIGNKKKREANDGKA